MTDFRWYPFWIIFDWLWWRRELRLREDLHIKRNQCNSDSLVGAWFYFSHCIYSFRYIWFFMRLIFKVYKVHHSCNMDATLSPIIISTMAILLISRPPDPSVVTSLFPHCCPFISAVCCHCTSLLLYVPPSPLHHFVLPVPLSFRWNPYDSNIEHILQKHLTIP